MNLLLDTHVLLWWLDDNPALDKNKRRAIMDGNNLIFVSAVVIWEIHIKSALGKLIIPSDFRQVIDQQDFEPLPITLDHAHTISRLPHHHRDPFDRMLVAQAIAEKFTLVTFDTNIRKYNVSIL